MHPIELRRVPPFAALASADLAQAAIAVRCADHRHGAPLFRVAEPCTSVPFVLDGFVRLYRPMPDGGEVTTGIVGPGGLLAAAALRGQGEHDDAATALGYVRTVDFPAPTLLDLAGRCPPLFAELALCLAARVDDAHAGAAAAAKGYLMSRVLYALRRLTRSNCLGIEAGSFCPLAVRLSHAELARLVGAERASVSRLLRVLGERGVVRREHGHVTGVVAAPAPGGTDAPRAEMFGAGR